MSTCGVLRRQIAGPPNLHSPCKAEAARYEFSIFCASVLRSECIRKRSATIELAFSVSGPDDWIGCRVRARAKRGWLVHERGKGEDWLAARDFEAVRPLIIV
jgi:hypothetical protein